MANNQLDDLDFVTRLDPKGMYRLTTEFPDQCRKALEIGRAAQLSDLALKSRLVVLTGLGGSAAGGDITRAIFEAHGGIPFIVNRDYHLPTFVGVGDIVFCCSYSGNTEETLSAYDSAKRLGAKIIVVTSGGKLAERATADENVLITIPGGQPPRTALGFMAVPVIVACERLSLIPVQDYEAAFSLLESCVSKWSVESSTDSTPKEIARALYGAVGILYGLGSWQGLVANRWKGQINENAKNMAFANSFPELNHNEILGWVKANEQGVAKWVGVVLEDGTESEKMKARAKVTADLVKDVCQFHTARAKGTSLLERTLSLTLLGDFVSLYLAALNGVDPENIDSINTLKAELASV
jgi:glucose/mannose-6-phosphate isomerase